MKLTVLYAAAVTLVVVVSIDCVRDEEPNAVKYPGMVISECDKLKKYKSKKPEGCIKKCRKISKCNAFNFKKSKKGGCTFMECPLPIPEPTVKNKRYDAYIFDKEEVSDCDPACQNGGTCNEAGKCDCPPGWTGDACDIVAVSDCDPACQNGGICNEAGKCDCPPGWTGDYCDIDTKPSFGDLLIQAGNDTNKLSILNEIANEVAQHNQLFEHNGVSYKKGLNEFSLLSYEEFIEHFTGLKEPDQLLLSSGTYYDPIDLGNEPAAKNYVELGAVNPIKNQGGCGSCWAFGAVSSIESQISLKKGAKETLSEQYLVDCVSASYGCRGGWHHHVFEHVIDNGIAFEDEYPYKAKNGQCNKNTPKTNHKLASWKKVQHKNDEHLLNAVVHVGPIPVAIHVSRNFQAYDSGIFDDDACTSSTRVNHLVSIVGYGSENGKDYWLLRNSWGKSWGEEGYMKMSRSKLNHCKISEIAYFPVLEDKQVPDCSEGVVIGGKCLILSTDKLSWNDAKKRCSSQNMRLAIIDEPQAFKDYVIRNHHTLNYVNKHWWVGGSDINEEGKFVWVNGQPIGDQFPWHQGEPNAYYENEDCLALWGGWAYIDDPCTRGYNYVCEKDSCTSVGGTHVAGQCLIFNDESKTWDQAKSSCEAKGQRLAVLQNPAAVNTFLQNNYAGQYIWLGASDSAEEGNWVWINGMSAQAVWTSSHPNNDANQDCLAWGWLNNYDDGWCTHSNPYICEYDILDWISSTGSQTE